MQNTDWQYIERCIHLIEEHYRETVTGEWRQRDLERFQQDLESQTGIRLSLSTLKRLWRSQFAQLPHAATLDALASFLDYKDWYDFKAKQQLVPTPIARQPKRFKVLVPLSVAVVALAVVLVIIANLSFTSSPSPILIEGDVSFSLDKTVTSGVPNTVLFRYDVSNVSADSFFIQQSWNKRFRHPVDPRNKVYTSIYYIPGYHRAKLVANDSIIAVGRLHLLTDGWVAYGRYDYADPIPVYLSTQQGEGALTLDRSDTESKIKDWSKGWNISYSNVQAYDAHSDSFELESSLKLATSPDQACAYVEMRVLTEEHIFYVSLTNKGCEGENVIKVGEKVVDGQTTDLSAFGADLSEWNTVNLAVRDRNAVIHVNGSQTYEVAFEESFGEIKGLVMLFSGPGLVDYVTLKNADQRIVYHEDFGGPAVKLVAFH
ncbi:MAG: hypothetical protein AAGA85_27200 [Bacteroidota bacterium]